MGLAVWVPNQIAAIPISARRIDIPVRRVTESSRVDGEYAVGLADAHAPPLTIASERVDDGRRRRFECPMPAGRVRFVEEPSYTIKSLDRSTWTAFATLVERNNGIFGGCWCIGFHPEGVDRSAQGEVNRERKHERVRSGTTHAALVFDGEGCVGWCQFGSPDEVPRIKNRAAYEKSQTTSPDWHQPTQSSPSNTSAACAVPDRTRSRFHSRLSSPCADLSPPSGWKAMHQQPPKIPLLCSTRAANAAHVDVSRGLIV